MFMDHINTKTLSKKTYRVNGTLRIPTYVFVKIDTNSEIHMAFKRT